MGDRVQQKYVPKIQLNRNFRICGDHMRDMLLTTGGSSSSGDSNSKFVGYRLSSDGKSIGFGRKIENNMDCDLLSPALMSSSCISQQPLVASSSHLDQEDAIKEMLFELDQDCPSSSTFPEMFQLDDHLVDQVGFDDDLLRGTGSPCHEFEWEEFDTIFKHDD